jgi:hypothetical protein
MVNKRTIKNILFFSLLISLIVYHGLTFIQEYFFYIEDSNWTSLITIVRIIVTSILIFITLESKFIAKQFLGKGFVSGEYKGISKQKENPLTDDHFEDFEISQSILWTTISGTSHLKSGEIVSNWKGELIEYDGNRDFKFAITLQTTNGNKLGIMMVRIDSEKFTGFYFPTETSEQNYISTFEGMKKDTLKTKP